MWHVKDMEDSDDRFFTEVGNGVIDWLPIFKKEGYETIDGDVWDPHPDIVLYSGSMLRVASPGTEKRRP